MVEKLFNYYKKEYKVDWLPSGDVEAYDKSIKQDNYVGFVIYFNKKNKAYAITVDSEMLLILKKKKYLFGDKMYWKQINHIHIDGYDKEEVIGLVNSYLK